MTSKVHLLRLYAKILRLHRAKLPFQLRDVGDQYVRDEFRSMWNLKDMSKHAGEFTKEWENYSRTLSLTAGPDGQPEKQEEGDTVDPRQLNKLSEEQKEQLKRLKDEIDSLSR